MSPLCAIMRHYAPNCTSGQTIVQTACVHNSTIQMSSSQSLAGSIHGRFCISARYRIMMYLGWHDLWNAGQGRHFKVVSLNWWSKDYCIHPVWCDTPVIKLRAVSPFKFNSWRCSSSKAFDQPRVSHGCPWLAFHELWLSTLQHWRDGIPGLRRSDAQMVGGIGPSWVNQAIRQPSGQPESIM